MSIQLAYHSIKYPRGTVENMMVKIDKFVFPVDFVILDMHDDKNVPLILGRPFLATNRAPIDVCNGKLTLLVYKEKVTFDIGRSVKHPQHHDDSLYFINVSDSIMSCHLQDVLEEGACNTKPIEVKGKDIIYKKHTPNVEAAEDHEIMDYESEPKAKLSIEEPLTLELEELPSYV